MAYSGKNIFFIALAFGALNLLPLLLIPGPGGDVIFHYTLIDCLSTQLWQGNIYPRWCVDADAGLGSPQFLFYFPLSYYLAALFYPLQYFGATIDTRYLTILWAINTLTFLTCWLWLKEVISPGRALLVSVFFLFMPYRMELMVYRSAYAELCCVAWLPLLFLFTRRLIGGDIKNWVWLSCATAVCLLTHVPAALAGLFACGLQVLFLTRHNLKPKLYFAAALLLAGAATLFYTLPAKYFSHYLHPEVLDIVHTTWANSYVIWEDLTTRGHLHLMVGLGATVLLVVGLAILTLKNTARIDDAYTRQESKLWILTAVLAFFLLFEISAPLWQLVTEYLTAAFPWRMQVLIMCAATYLLAIKTQWLMSAKQLKTWKWDYVAAVGVTVLFGLFMLTTRDESLIATFNKAVRYHMVQATVYRSRWSDKDAMTGDHIMALAENGNPRAHIIKGGGTVTEQNWDWRDITLNTDMSRSGTIRLKHLYFPIWYLTIDGKPSEGLTPEPHSGLILIQAPAGKHTLQLHTDVAAAVGWAYTLAKIISLAAAGLWVFLVLRQKRYNVENPSIV